MDMNFCVSDMRELHLDAALKQDKLFPSCL